MSTYKKIRGTHIVTVVDPPAPINGQMWYNSTEQRMKGFTSSPAGTWSTAANMNTARHSGIASAGANRSSVRIWRRTTSSTRSSGNYRTMEW